MRQKSCTKAFCAIRDFATGPGFFFLAGLAYLLASSASAMDLFLQSMNPRVSVTPLAFAVFLAGLIAYMAGLKTAKIALRLGRIPLVAGFVAGTVAAFFILEMNLFAAVLFNAAALIICLILLNARFRHEYAFGAGFCVFWMNLAVFGIPLLQPQMHVQLFTIINALFIIGFVLMVYSLIRLFPRYRLLWPVVLISTVFSTYRVYMGIVFISWVLLELKQSDRMERKRVLWLVLLAVFLAAVFFYVGYLSVKSQHADWILDPVRTMEYRLGLTMGVFTDIVGISFPFGHTFGGSLTMEATEFTCRVLYGCTSRITSTAFGVAMLDFGIAGVLLAGWWVGVVLGNVRRKDYPLYCFLFAVALSAIDVGINIFAILLFIYLGWTGLVVRWKRKK